MKKTLFFFAMASLAMVSCSKDETTGINNGYGIGFRASLDKASRAAETTTANLTSFFVTALDKNDANYFTAAEFTKNGGSFSSNPAYYWPADGSSLNFYAYAPAAADLGGTLTIDKTTKQLAGFQPAAAIGSQQDFVVAKATGSKADEATGVALTFDHALAQIELKAKNTVDGYVYKVKGVRIGQPVSKANYDFAASTWTPGADKANYQVEYAAEKTLTATAASIMETENDNAMLIPQQLTAWTPATDKTNASKGAYLAVKVNITTKDGAQVYPTTAGAYDWVAVPVDTNWEAGKKYIYTLDFSNGAGKVDPEKTEDPADPFKPGEDILGSAIKFTVTVNTWTDAASDITM